jgi:hypothetical protein
MEELKDKPYVLTYCGKEIEYLTKEELIEAIHELYEELKIYKDKEKIKP